MNDLQKAIKITEQVFRVAEEIIIPGITEKQIASKLRKCAICNGADGLAFRTIVASSNYMNIHSFPRDRKIKENEFVIVDFGVRYKRALTDVTRTYCINPDTRKKKHYNLLKITQRRAEKMIRVGVSCSKVDISVRKYLKQHTKLKFPYALGHGVTNKIHARPKISPKSKDVFKVGDVFTLEPGLHSKSIGLRIEDMYLLKKTGIVKLTK
ncbi:MAG: M24 family metallopeptidase [Nanoarchaeota archaeon]|nr:M24 family metallopeptidase [Nanoarchaeota archaeon]MBU4124308.1 M24 family metallopeptidase [Nanoarchaeota archaeon]